MSTGRAGSIISVQVGRVAPLGPEGVASGFVKLPVMGPVAVRRLGLVGDAQADLRVHGGPEKAVYLYPAEHYASWQLELPEHAAVLVPGGFGENLTMLGLDEDAICIGDVLRTGSALLQVTQPRQPCFKLALRFADPRLLRMMLRSGRSGWYARVLEDGVVESSSPIVVTDRLNPAWPVSRLVHLIAHHSATLEDMVELSELSGLAEHWRVTATDSVKRAARANH
ncbi:MAG TPA: MOSC domain-containing protein [Steroidobacteraceae bacterium]|jgi:MOSC domain-containing protein YiiM|nr:MOSC domain-containing protein [Steroidobacteraceae bacterium]